MATPLYQFLVKDGGTVRDDWLRTLRNGLISRGVSNPNVSPNSDFYVMGQAFGNEASIAMANCVLKADELMPDTATGSGLDRQGTQLGLTRRSAGGSIGQVVFSSSASSLITTGSQLLDGAGLRYQVSVGGTYANGDLIPVSAVDTGSATNLAAASTLRWISPPAFAATTVTVNTGGFTNGVDAEDDESYRARIFARLQTFPAGGNWQYVAQVSEGSSSSVQKAFVYPAIQGPATLHVAVAAAPTTTNKNRDIAAATVTGTITPYIQGLIPEHAYSVITSVTNVPVDLAIGLSIPSATTATPPGPGGGWLDGTPWPATTGTPVTVTGVTSTTQFTVNATASPTANVTHISWLSPSTWTLYSGLVTQVGGTTGAWVVTVDTPFVGITTGSYIFPQAQNQSTYVAALLAFFALMGPGEKSSNASALLRGFRHPTPSNSWPYTIGATMLKSVTASGSEVADAQFLYRTDGTTTITGSAGTVTPQIPGAVTSAPNLYTPRNIAFYQI